MNLESVMNIVVSTVNFIRRSALNHRQFQQFLLEIEAEYGDVFYHTEIRWLGNYSNASFNFATKLKFSSLKNKSFMRSYLIMGFSISS
jgi:hypothetical protein